LLRDDKGSALIEQRIDDPGLSKTSDIDDSQPGSGVFHICRSDPAHDTDDGAVINQWSRRFFSQPLPAIATGGSLVAESAFEIGDSVIERLLNERGLIFVDTVQQCEQVF